MSQNPLTVRFVTAAVLIALIRKRFSGNLAYSANRDNYRSVPFWGQLDEIGVNSYHTLGTGPEVAVEQIKKSLGADPRATGRPCRVPHKTDPAFGSRLVQPVQRGQGPVGLHQG